MICCKISTNYNSPDASFGGLVKGLSKIGDVLWDNGFVYFGCVDEPSVDAKKISQILRKNGYKEFYIDSYTKENQPHDGDYINGWVSDKLIKINYKKYEDESQAVFRNISRGLDLLNNEIARLHEEQSKTQSKEKGVES